MVDKYNPQQIEEEILKFWETNKILEKAKEKNKKGKKFYFLDGPPYTSGRIHLGQAWNKSMKDCVLRYKRMQGFNVWDRAGYDMHGLPTANKVMEKLGLKNKDDIPKHGISKFIKECINLSTTNMEMMNKDFHRLGIWMDFKNAYQSIKQSFMESEWWLVKKAYENGRLYEGEKTMHWCASCATALAKHELEYQQITDNSVFVKFELADAKNEYLIIWTTTPWTLAFNLAVMVHPELDYVKIQVGSERWIVAKGLVGIFMGSVVNKKYEVISEFTGTEMQGLRYKHPWSEEISPFKDIKSDKLHSVILSLEYVDLSAGTGLVHCAPGCGPEDYEVGHREGLPPFNNIDEQGIFPEGMGKFSGFIAKIDDKKFIDALGDSLIEKTPVEHEYAHCWRCHKPVVFKTTKQWFFKVEDLIDDMEKLNKDVFWQPDWAGNNWFDSWLSNLRDNGITRQRYWGTPLPIWRCEKCDAIEVIGSIDELSQKAGKVPDDLHRPWIDDVMIKCKCGFSMKRIPDILDVWIDAGTASWACLDYPQNEAEFKKWWPADFILEGKDQIRGWFNLLLIASIVSMGKHSYKACYMHGFVQDSSGRKMSKSLGNIISPYEIVDKYGADTLRYYLIGGANPGLDLNYNSEDTKIKHKNLTVLWNLHKFLIDCANDLCVSPIKLDNLIEKSMSSIEERYILSKLYLTIEKVTNLFDEYKLNEVPPAIEELFLDLSRTYIQLVREKSAVGSKEDKEIVLYTVFTVLFETLKMFSVIAPFITEAIYQSLKKEFGLKQKSIHLYDFPKPNSAEIDNELIKNMDLAGTVIQSCLAAREKIRLGVRWPLQEVIFVTKDEKTIRAIEKLGDIIKNQVNIKEIKIQETLPGLKTSIKADFKQLGPDFGKNAPKIIAKLVSESPATILSHLEKDGKYELKIGEEKFNIVKEHIIVETTVPSGYQEMEFKSGYLYLNSKLNDELEAEGYAREVMRRVQSLRKKAGMQKTDSITLYIKTDSDTVDMLSKHEKLIKEKVGAEKLKIASIDPVKKHKNASTEKIKGKTIQLFFSDENVK
ncbi:MAG: isoleucine--tRNA ligase [Nanoarchaeota archaeon]